MEAWEGKIRLWKARPRKCGICGVIYRENENVGAWKCLQPVNKLHLMGPTDTFYIRSDHRVHAIAYTDPMPMPENVYVKFFATNTNPSAVKMMRAASDQLNVSRSVLVYRHDKRTEQHLLESDGNVYDQLVFKSFFMHNIFRQNQVCILNLS